MANTSELSFVAVASSLSRRVSPGSVAAWPAASHSVSLSLILSLRPTLTATTGQTPGPPTTLHFELEFLPELRSPGGYLRPTVVRGGIQPTIGRRFIPPLADATSSILLLPLLPLHFHLLVFLYRQLATPSKPYRLRLFAVPYSTGNFHWVSPSGPWTGGTPPRRNPGLRSTCTRFAGRPEN